MSDRARQRGVALVLALLVVALLTATILPFLYDGRVERSVAANLYTGLQAATLAASGVEVAEALLRQDAADDANPQAKKPHPYAYDGLDEIWARYNDLPLAVAGGVVSLAVADEGGKINLNNLVSPTGPPNEFWLQAVRRLLARREQDPALVEPLVDWLDRDSQPFGFGGAEESYYLGLTPPYRPADGPLATVAELRLVKGWTPEVVAAVTPFVTVARTPTPVNLNTAPAEVLAALADGMSEACVRALVETRQRTPLRTVTEVGQVPGCSGLDTQALGRPGTASVTSRLFSVVVTASFRDSRAVVRAILERQPGGRGVIRRYWRAE
ncbi:MAG TPA: type II secretion system minor pseudopilin GspK [Thermodesulfobacteriota bacterium]|nr:type II secretion system minor pseudopilin GspK [Thermodesulfobacteriota bacterium]